MISAAFIFLFLTWQFMAEGKNLPCKGQDCRKSSVPLINNVRAPLFAELDITALNKDLKSYIDSNIEDDIKDAFENNTENVVSQKMDKLKATMLHDFSLAFNSSVMHSEKDLLQVSKKVETEFQDLKKDLSKTISTLNSTFKRDIEEWKRNISKQNKDILKAYSESVLNLRKDVDNFTSKMHDDLVEMKKIRNNLLDNDKELQEDLLEIKNIQRNLSEKIKVIHSFTRDCRTLIHPVSGIYFIALKDYVFEVYCDAETDGGGWTIIQNRFNGSVDFYRTWSEYENGFGSVTGEHWLGNKYIHAITSQRQYELRIDLEDWEGEKRYVTYSTFSVGDQASKYKLTVGGYNGTGGLQDKLTYHSNNKFSAMDQNNDEDTFRFCVQRAKGGWWYKDCHHSNLNGLYKKAFSSDWNVMSWNSWHGEKYSLKASKMMIR